MTSDPTSRAPGLPEVLPTREGYDRWAEIYDEDDNPLVALEGPRVAELLGDVRELRIADVGCGTGRHAERLAAAGARVVALDFSASMLGRARAKPGARAVHFVRHDLTAPLPFPAASFDRAICCLVMDHIPDPGSLLAELARIVKSEGFVLVSVMHPAMMLKGVQARFTDPATGRQVRPRSFPHQIADYVMAMARAGLELDHLSEHAVDEDLAARLPRARKYLGWPLLFLARLRPAGEAAGRRPY